MLIDEYIPHGMASHNDWPMSRGSDGRIGLLHPEHHQHPVCWQVCHRHYLTSPKVTHRLSLAWKLELIKVSRPVILSQTVSCLFVRRQRHNLMPITTDIGKDSLIFDTCITSTHSLFYSTFKTHLIFKSFSLLQIQRSLIAIWAITTSNIKLLTLF